MHASSEMPAQWAISVVAVVRASKGRATAYSALPVIPLVRG
ncbi:hypothetical protein [Streptomyces humicola]|nr:hypothetical protein [Streptomyces humicola]